jgi:hypothetical protein
VGFPGLFKGTPRAIPTDVILDRRKSSRYGRGITKNKETNRLTSISIDTNECEPT